jgi:6-pyruvoyltetrahydropterin 2'-reductase
MEKHIFLSDDKIFHTIEGEGEYIGKPSVFMRVSMCNLTCKGFASKDSPHGCDSFVSWSVKNKMTYDEILDLMEQSNYIKFLNRGDILKITGGEPLVQQKNLLEFMRAFVNRYSFVPRIDFETNATLLPLEPWYDEYFATFTTSPKLSNNGDPENKRYIPSTLEWHAKNGSGFKFVVAKESDLDEIYTKYIDRFNIRRNKIWLMPCCGSREEHVKISPIVAEFCKERGLNFSPRLQLVIWDKALKV